MYQKRRDYSPAPWKRSLPAFFAIKSLKRCRATISLRATWIASVRDFTPRTFAASSANSVSRRIDVMANCHIYKVIYLYIHVKSGDLASLFQLDKDLAGDL